MNSSIYCQLFILLSMSGCLFLRGAGDPKHTSFDQYKNQANQEAITKDGAKYDNITLDVGATKVITVGYKLTKLSLANTSKLCDFQKNKNNIAFWIFEVHTDTLKVNLTLTPDSNDTKDALEVPGKTMGSNLGLVVLNNQTNNNTSCEPASVYLHNNNGCQVEVIVLVRGYKKDDPVPGLGNSKRNITGLNPHLYVTWDQYLTTLRFKPAGSLEQSHRKNLNADTLVYKYSIYQYWLKEGKFDNGSYINTLSTMLLRYDIETKGKLVQDFYQKKNVTGQGMVEVRFPTFPGTPQLYAVIVSTSKETFLPSKQVTNEPWINEKTEQDFYSVYISTASAGCHLQLTNSEDFNELYTKEKCITTTGCIKYHYTETKVMLAFTLLMGMFVLFLGHQFITISQFIYGLLLVGLLAYPILASQLGDTSHFWILMSCVGAGVVGGILTMILWISAGRPLLATIFPALMGGGIFGSIVLFVCGCLQQEFLVEDEFFYGILLAVIAIYVGVTIPFPSFCHILSSAIIGGYLIALTVDFFIGSSIKYSLLNITYRLFVPGYDQACLQLPFQDYEKLVISMWAISTIVGLVFQLWKNPNRTSFPQPFVYHNPYRRLQDEERNETNQIPPVNEMIDAGVRESEVPNPSSPSSFTGFSYPYQRGNNDRSTHLHITTLDIDQAVSQSNDMEDSRNHHEAEVVGYIQGYGPVTADPNISAAVIRVLQNPSLYEDRPIRASSPRQKSSSNTKQGGKLHERFKKTLAKSAPRSSRDNASEEDVSSSTGVKIDRQSKLRKSKDIFKPPTPESSSPE